MVVFEKEVFDFFQNVIFTHFSTLSSMVALRAFPAVGKFVIYHSRRITYLRNRD